MHWPWSQQNHPDGASQQQQNSSRRPSSNSKGSTAQDEEAYSAQQSAEAHLHQRNLLDRMLGLKGKPRRKIKAILANDSTVDDSFFCQGDDGPQAAIAPHRPSFMAREHHPQAPKTPKSPVGFRKMKSIMSLSAAFASPGQQLHKSDPNATFEAQQREGHPAAQKRAAAADLQGSVQVDCLWECQRGLLLFGLPCFSSNALFSFDPKRWITYENGKSRNSAYDRGSVPLPSAEWAWLDAAFLINMSNDAAVDEQGWSYAFCFANRRHWNGRCQWYTFVRRRQWVRARMRVPDQESPEMTERPQLPERSNTLDRNAPFLHPQLPSHSQQQRPLSVRINSSKYKHLPLSDLEMEGLILAEASLDVRDPFLRWSEIKKHGLESYPWMASDETHQTMWKENVIEVNFERAMRCLKTAKVDRERTQLWKHWLGLEFLTTLPPVFQKSHDTPPSPSTKSSHEEPDLEDLPRPDVQDVWDLAEARLDDLLLAYFFQSSKEEFLSLLPAAHDQSHARHHFRGWDQMGKTIPDAIAAHPQIDWSDFQAAHILPRISFTQEEERPSVTRFHLMRENMRQKRSLRRDASFATARDTSMDEGAQDEEDVSGGETPSDMMFSTSPLVLSPANSSAAASYFKPSHTSSSAHRSPEPSASQTHAFLSPTPQQPSILNTGEPGSIMASSRARSISFAGVSKTRCSQEPDQIPLPPSPPASEEGY